MKGKGFGALLKFIGGKRSVDYKPMLSTRSQKPEEQTFRERLDVAKRRTPLNPDDPRRERLTRIERREETPGGSAARKFMRKAADATKTNEYGPAVPKTQIEAEERERRRRRGSRASFGG